jgi:hypothetical protein
MGQTIGCAQCHDHKFDPITSRDFYSLGAFFADIREGIIAKPEDGMPVPDAEHVKEQARLVGEIASAQKELDAPRPELAGAFAKWEEEQRAAVADTKLWQVLVPASVASQGGANLTVQKDGVVLVSGKNPETDTYTVTVTGELANATGLRLEALPDDSLPAKGSGRSSNGNFVVSEVVATVKRAGGSLVTQTFDSAVASFEQTVATDKNPYQLWSAASAIDGDVKGPGFGWAVLPQVGKPQQLVLKFAQPVSIAAGDSLLIELKQNHENHTLGKFRLSTTADASGAKRVVGTSAPAEIEKLLAVALDKRTAAQKEELFSLFKTDTPELAKLRVAVDQAKKAKTDFDAKIPKCLVTVSDTNHRVVRILPRGDWMNETGEVVKAALPHYLPGPDFGDKIPNRLDLAQWLVSKENPLTARTVINRMWKQFFGIGLSKVLDDLGAQGEPPPNQALLDWLACEFIDSGWDMKHMVRTIVTSSTYKQVSSATPEQLAADPLNRHVARQSPFRLDAELVRDNALATAGLLVYKIGGPSVKPYQPDGYWENLNFPVRSYDADQGENQYRRGLYVWWQRSFLHPSMLAFDAPSREECAAERNRSNIPQQALALLNDPSYVEASRALAARILTESPGDTATRLQWAWQQVLQRAPLEAELKTITPLLDERLAAYRADSASAEALLKVGLLPAPATLDKAELAAWTHVARVLLNLHETITRS